MLKANELRIGNLVKIGGEISQLELCDFVDIYEHKTIWQYEPIELTEDWLIDNGFYAVEVDSGEYYYQNYRFRLNSNYAGFYYSRNLTVKYVHQLQNLYFALTGSELQVNVA